MAYNAFPVGYQPAQIYYPQQQYNAVQQPQTQQALTPPTIHAEIIQVDNEQAAEAFPLSAGSSQMMIARDDSAIFVKTMYPNGQYKLDAFLKRPEMPRNASGDSDVYVTRDEFEKRLKEILESHAAKEEAPKARKATKEES